MNAKKWNLQKSEIGTFWLAKMIKDWVNVYLSRGGLGRGSLWGSFSRSSFSSRGLGERAVREPEG